MNTSTASVLLSDEDGDPAGLTSGTTVRSQAVPHRLDRIEADDIQAPAEIGRSMTWISLDF